MFGDNPLRPPLLSNGSILSVKTIFKTLQGEGPYAGWPSIFIRLGGCNLACRFCDTDFENFDEMSIGSIIEQVQCLRINEQKQKVINLIVITGGEPLRQNIRPLCEQLLSLNLTVQIETNGTLYQNLPKQIKIICSPKTVLRDDLMKRVSALKYLIAKNLPNYASVPKIDPKYKNIPIYVQPMDQNDTILNEDNVKLTIEIALKYGYRYSHQLHKTLNIE